jgi:phytoene dehydrogenase-like protein
MLIPSTVDDSLAPPGQHVASLFCQQFAPSCPMAATGTTTGRRADPSSTRSTAMRPASALDPRPAGAHRPQASSASSASSAATSCTAT